MEKQHREWGSGKKKAQHRDWGAVKKGHSTHTRVDKDAEEKKHSTPLGGLWGARAKEAQHITEHHYTALHRPTQHDAHTHTPHTPAHTHTHTHVVNAFTQTKTEKYTSVPPRVQTEPGGTLPRKTEMTTADTTPSPKHLKYYGVHPAGSERFVIS